ncbi:FtsH protease activity modulator HflK [Brevibacillus migulae]|uniref:FtsH protease activity modulator HflK n=1 Tax=Brevibacillus migulae TaxID=1644114 RepID=UPI00106E3A46|nr:FtsH protease activity modulator HflK [Brevibacillus migulae]
MTLKHIYQATAGIIILLILVLVALTSWYTVDQSEQALVLTLGEVTEEIKDPGLHFKAPWPIQSVEVFSRETYSLVFGYGEVDGQPVVKMEEAKMLTGDENILLAGLVVQWRIGHMADYLFNAEDPQTMLYNATSAALRGVIGNSTIDSALTDGKAEIEQKVREQLTTLINSYEIGIEIVDVKLQNVDLPNDNVRKAFTEVTDAREQMNTKINEARKYENQKLNEAKGEAEAKLSRAEGVKTSRIETAKGDTANFNALYQSYKASPQITQERLILETMEQIMPGAQIYIMDDNGGTVKYLPIQPLQPNQAVQKGAEQR